jgi:hypothetical protein
LTGVVRGPHAQARRTPAIEGGAAASALRRNTCKQAFVYQPNARSMPVARAGTALHMIWADWPVPRRDYADYTDRLAANRRPSTLSMFESVGLERLDPGLQVKEAYTGLSVFGNAAGAPIHQVSPSELKVCRAIPAVRSHLN